MQKRTLTLMILIVLASILMTPAVFSSFSFIAWIDTLFALSIFVTMIGTALYIIEKGFFNSFIRTIKYFMRNINKRRQVADEIEQKNHYSYEDNDDKIKKYRLTVPCLTAGGILLFLSICLSII